MMGVRWGYSLYALPALALAAALLTSGALTPTLSIHTYAHGKPVNARVQVFALLPPGAGGSIVEVWSGTSSNGVAEVPLQALRGVAMQWAEEGVGNGGVGIEVITTYANASTEWYGMRFTTYEPNAVISEAGNPMIWMAAAIRGRWRVDVEASNSLQINQIEALKGVTTSTSTPTPPAPPFCSWAVDWSWQSPETYIPLIWAEDGDGNAFLGVLYSFALGSQSVSISFSASAAVPTGSAKTPISFQIIGTSLADTTSSSNVTYFGANNPSLAAMYTRGTVGVAELELWCSFDGGLTWLPTGEYVNESYVQSSDFEVYPSSAVGASYLSQALNELSKYYTLSPVPFDEVSLTHSGQGYEYTFYNLQRYSPFAFSASIPVGAIALAVASAAGVDMPVTALIAAGLVSTIRESTTTIAVNVVSLGTENYPAFGDVLMAQLPISYAYDGHSFYPPLAGVYVEPFGHYSSGTHAWVGPGGVVVDPTCMPPNDWSGSVSVFVGSSPLMVPGGPVVVTVAGPFGYSASYSYSMPPHEPLSVALPLPHMEGTYNVTVSYGPYATPQGTMHYGPSSASTKVSVVLTPCH